MTYTDLTFLVDLSELEDGCLMASLEFTKEYPAYHPAPTSVPRVGSLVTIAGIDGKKTVAMVEESITQMTFRVRPDMGRLI